MRNDLLVNYLIEERGLDIEYIGDLEILLPYVKEVIGEKDSDAYKGNLFIRVGSLSQVQKLSLIDLFLDSYTNTNQDRSVYSIEFVTVTDVILQGLVPLVLTNLRVEEIYNNIYEIISRI